MNITITQNQGIPPVTIMHLEGVLDGYTHASLSDEAQRLYTAGARDLILDLSKLTYISSAGIAALHKVVLIFRGETLANMQEGWAAFHAIENDRGSGVQEHVKLLSPSEPVQRTLDLVGFSAFFEIHTDVQRAAGSFLRVRPAMADSLL